MKETIETAIISAIRTMLRPLVRLLLRNGVPVQSFFELAKDVYVDVAMTEFDLPGKKQTNSRVSILTGLSRKEVQRIVQQTAEDDSKTQHTHNRAASVVSGWIRDPEFTKESDHSEQMPVVLNIEGDGATFSLLVKRYSGDMPVRAVLDELVRVGVVERVGKEQVKLIARAYVPSHSSPDKLRMLGTDVSDLIATIDHNITDGQTDPMFQRKVMYDNVPVAAAQEFRTLSAARSQALIEAFDQWLAQHDRDSNPEVTGEGRMRTGIGIYYFEELVP